MFSLVYFAVDSNLNFLVFINYKFGQFVFRENNFTCCAILSDRKSDRATVIKSSDSHSWYEIIHRICKFTSN